MRQQLFSDFLPVTKSEWKDFVRKSGRTDPDSLLWDPSEGFTSDPYHDKSSTANIRNPLYQHEKVKLLRKVAPEGDQPVSELNLSRQFPDDAIVPLIHSRLRYNRGSSHWEINGFPIENPLFFCQWLQGTEPFERRIFIDAGFAGPLLASCLSGRSRDTRAVSLLYDPFTSLLDSDSGTPEESMVLKLLPELIRPEGSLLCADGYFYAEAGATIVEQVAYVTAVLSEILVNLPSDKRVIAAKKMVVRFASGPLYFPEMAKLRAMRILWMNLLKAFGLPETGQLEIVSETSALYKTRLDAENNLIRNTSEAFASIAGGASYLLIHPHNEPFEPSGMFTRRMAENIYHILGEEVFADAVSDPAAGSYYIENLTDTIADKAWSLFQEIEAEGGFLEAITNGSVQKRVRSSADVKKQHYSSGKRKLVGLNIFPSDPDDEKTGRPADTFRKLVSDTPPVKLDPERPILPQWSEAITKGALLADLLPVPSGKIETLSALKAGFETEQEFPVRDKNDTIPKSNNKL